MKEYSWVLFDADDTLFHFDAFTGLKLMFAGFGMAFSSQDYEDYEKKNRSLWGEYQQGNISIAHLKTERFIAWAERLGNKALALELNTAYMNVMSDICVPLEGALHLLSALKTRTKIGIVTNGLTQLQQIRLERTGLKEYIDLLVVSEEVGIAKPNKGIFDYSLLNMGNPSPSEVLMVGDTLESDILGGLNAGFDTCWLNTKQKPTQDSIVPHYQVSSLLELKELICAF